MQGEHFIKIYIYYIFQINIYIYVIKNDIIYIYIASNINIIAVLQ